MEAANREAALKAAFQKDLELTARKHDEEVRRLRNDLESANADRGEQNPTAPNLMSFGDPRQEPQNHTLGYHEEPSPIQGGGRYPGTEQASGQGDHSP